MRTVRTNNDTDNNDKISADDNDSTEGDSCTNQCKEMREVCQQTGQDVTSDGQGCYTPCDPESVGGGRVCPYERRCELVCLSF